MAQSYHMQSSQGMTTESVSRCFHVALSSKVSPQIENLWMNMTCMVVRKFNMQTQSCLTQGQLSQIYSISSDLFLSSLSRGTSQQQKNYETVKFSETRNQQRYQVAKMSTMDLINEIKLKVYLLLEQLCTQRALCLTTETLPVCITAALFFVAARKQKQHRSPSADERVMKCGISRK